MTGPEHYQEAERLLAAGELPESERDYTAPSLEVLLAGVGHATLALAAAQDRMATFAETLGQVAMHTVFAGWSEDDVRAAQQWVRQAAGMEGGDGS